MRVRIAGIDADDRAAIISDRDYGAEADELTTLFETGPGFAIPSADRLVELVDLNVDPGGARWMLVTWPPGFRYDMHRTETIDFHLLLEGATDLELEDGVHRLNPGDATVIVGVNHAWHSEGGCRILLLLVGAQPVPRG